MTADPSPAPVPDPSEPPVPGAARPALDEGFTPLLAFLNGPDAQPMHQLDPEEARASFRLLTSMAGPTVDGVTRHDRVIPGPAGDLPVRIVTPDDGDPVGVLVWFHGGGWVIGDLDTTDDTVTRLAVATGCVVVSVDYRLAPEHPAPAPLDDCWAATVWADAHRDELGAPGAPLAVGGDSAGGNLAAAVALRAGADGGPTLAAQLLVYPVTDLAMDTDSYRANGEGYFLTAATMAWFGDHYLSGGADRTDPAVAPLRATDAQLAATAPAIVHVAGYDPLRDEGVAYAERLTTAGVPTELVEFPTMLHGFYGLVAFTPVAADAITQAAASLTRHFTAAVPTP